MRVIYLYRCVVPKLVSFSDILAMQLVAKQSFFLFYSLNATRSPHCRDIITFMDALFIYKPIAFIGSMDLLWARMDVDCNNNGWFKKHRVVPNYCIHATYFNVSFGKLTKQIILTFLHCTFVPPLADTPPQGRHEPLHHHVSGAGGMSARQRLLLYLPPTELQKDWVRQLPRHQLLQVM